jgi:hypothetical protein
LLCLFCAGSLAGNRCHFFPINIAYINHNSSTNSLYSRKPRIAAYGRISRVLLSAGLRWMRSQDLLTSRVFPQGYNLKLPRL